MAQKREAKQVRQVEKKDRKKKKKLLCMVHGMYNAYPRGRYIVDGGKCIDIWV